VIQQHKELQVHMTMLMKRLWLTVKYNYFKLSFKVCDCRG